MAADHLTTPQLDRADTLRGAAALTDALDLIGSVEAAEAGDGDKRLAKIVVEAELEIRALLRFALAHIACEGP